MRHSHKKLSTVDQVIAELNSGYGRMGACGPLKEINGITLKSAAPDRARREVKAVIAVEAYQESPYGDCAHTERAFYVSLGDVARLAETAPMFRPSFAKMARQLETRLEKERNARRQALEDWCNAGLPTKKSTKTLRPLRLKNRGPG